MHFANHHFKVISCVNLASHTSIYVFATSSCKNNCPISWRTPYFYPLFAIHLLATSFHFNWLIWMLYIPGRPKNRGHFALRLVTLEILTWSASNLAQIKVISFLTLNCNLFESSLENKGCHLANDYGSNAPRFFWQCENVQFIEPNIWQPNSSDLDPVDYAIWGALQQMVCHHQSFVSGDELKRTIVEAWQKLPQLFINKSVGEWHRRLEWLCSATAGGHIELMFNWHVKCWLCTCFLWVCFVRLFDVIKEQTIAICHLLRLLSFTRWRHFIFQSWFK